MTVKRIRILVNPSARSGKGRVGLRRVRAAHLPEESARFEWVESRSASHFEELVRNGQHDGLDVLAVAGGDGTVAMALNCLNGVAQVPLGIVPIGSGNDFAKDLGIPGALAEALRFLQHARPRSVDVGRACWEGAKEDRRFCCVASIGLDALALRYIHGSGWPRSKALNLAASLWALCRYRRCRVRVLWRNGVFEGEIMFVAVTNTRGYGGGFLVSPEARLDDGLLDVCIVRRTGRLRLLGQFPRILQGTHGVMPEVTLARSPWVRLEGIGEELPVALDGELPQAMTPVELRCEPTAVQVLGKGTRT